MSDLNGIMQTVDFCKKGALSAFVEQRPFVLIFKTTNWCWNRCAHCCESSGPDQPKNFIPASIINGYMAQAAKDANFSGHVVFTGGEIMAAYKFAGEDYVPNILNYALDKKLNVDIKTNAGWAGTPVGEQIFRDIENAVRRHRPKIITSNTTNRTFPVHISLSMDRFHENSLERNFRFIKHFATRKINGARLVARISSFAFDEGMLAELLKRLHNSGLRVEQVSFIDHKTGNQKSGQFFLINGNMVLQYGTANLFAGGRAKNISYAYHDEAPQFTFIDDDFIVLVGIDSFGNVTLGENSGKKISVPWRTQNGDARSWSDIRTDLINETKRAEAEYLKQHQLLNFIGKWRK